jgi:hypothetical protein
MSSVTCPALQYFSTLSLDDTIFEKKVTEYWNVCFEFPYHFSVNYYSKEN